MREPALHCVLRLHCTLCLFTAAVAARPATLVLLLSAGPALRPRSLAGEWTILPEDIEICLHKDGSPWLLGQGRFGRVYRARKGGVQVDVGR